jgi:hypothetical protein
MYRLSRYRYNPGAAQRPVGSGDLTNFELAAGTVARHRR